MENLSKVSVLNPGKELKVAVQCLVHGNEDVGKVIIDKVRAQLNEDDLLGELVFVEANLRAYDQGVRYMDVDLNRQMSDIKLNSFAETDFESLSHEQQVALGLSEVLKGVDYLLDIHATRCPSKPFIYALGDELHKEICSVLPVDLVVLTDESVVPLGAMDEFVDSNGAAGFTLEAGGVGDYQFVDDMVNLVFCFLKKVGVLECVCGDSFESVLVEGQKYVKVNDFVAPEGFVYAKDFSNFDELSIGDLLGVDGNGVEYFVEEDCVILFAYPVVEGEVCLVMGVEAVEM